MSDNIKKFLARKEEEERRKILEEKKKRDVSPMSDGKGHGKDFFQIQSINFITYDILFTRLKFSVFQNLLSLRDHKAQSRINKHLKVCKAANKSVIADAIDNENTAVTIAGMYISIIFYNIVITKNQDEPFSINPCLVNNNKVPNKRNMIDSNNR